MPKRRIDQVFYLKAVGKQLINTPYQDKKTLEERFMRSLVVDYQAPGTVRAKPYEIILDDVPEWVIDGFENEWDYVPVEVLITSLSARANNNFASLSISGRLLKVDGKSVQHEEAVTDAPKATSATATEKTTK